MALTSLTVAKCDRTPGGIYRLLLCDAANIDDATVDISTDKHDLTDIDFSSAAVSGGLGFVEFTFRDGEARYEYTQERQDSGADVCTANIFMMVPAPTSANAHALEQLRGVCEVVAVTQDYDGQLRCFGIDYNSGRGADIGRGEFQALSGASGTNRTEGNQGELNIQFEQEIQPLLVTAETATGGATTDVDEIIAEYLTPTD